MQSDGEESRPRRVPFFGTVLGLLAVVVLVSMPFVSGDPTAREWPDWVRFLGRFHPVLLHLPIGVFVLVLLQELWLMLCLKPTHAGQTFPLVFGVISAVVAVLAGFLLYQGGGGDYAGSDLVQRHLWGGIAFAVVAIITLLVRCWSVGSLWYRVLLFGSVGVMTFASHDGASITHGENYLTQYAPAPIRKLLGLPLDEEKTKIPPAPTADPVVYDTHIAPILERRCVSCHKEGKAKGKLRMDTFELMLKGGSEGPSLVPGDSAESLIIQRIELPEEDDEHMPPKKPDITEDELAVLKWWIDAGADPQATLSKLSMPDDIKARLDAMPAAEAPVETTKSNHSSGPDEALKQQVAAFSKEFPGALVFEHEDSPYLDFSAVSMRGNFTDAHFAKLSGLLPHLVSLDLSATDLSDAALQSLDAAVNLKKLRLAETKLTDASMEVVAKLPALESLNLYGTAVTDAGARRLTTVKSLKNLYLWQTAVSPQVIEELRNALPDCEIITGVEN
jgi:uncharacterized membrane protein